MLIGIDELEIFFGEHDEFVFSGRLFQFCLQVYFRLRFGHDFRNDFRSRVQRSITVKAEIIHEVDRWRCVRYEDLAARGDILCV